MPYVIGKYAVFVRKTYFCAVIPYFCGKIRPQCNREQSHGQRQNVVRNKKTEVTKMKNQTIMCDVCACKHHNGKDCSCKLSKITVTPCKDCETAHYCKNYEEK